MVGLMIKTFYLDPSIGEERIDWQNGIMIFEKFDVTLEDSGVVEL